MKITSDSTLQQLSQAAALGVWSVQQLLASRGLPPFQQAYFLRQSSLASAALAEQVVAEHKLETMMAELERGILPKRAKQPGARALRNAALCDRLVAHLHKGSDLVYTHDGEHDNLGRPWPKRTKKPNA